MALPTIGQVVDGYAYSGGDPNDKKAWRWVGSVGPQAAVAQLDPKAPGSAYLPRRMDAASKSEEAYFRAFREKDDEGVQAARQGVARARRAEGLLARQKTGGIYAVPVLGGVAGMFDPEIRELDAIQSEVARSKRQPGEGAISDFDAKQFLAMTYGKDKPTETNRALIQGQRLADDARLQRRQFTEWHYNTFGSTTGAAEAWDRYIQDNPIFSPESESAGAPSLNPQRKNWRQYFGDVRTAGDTRETQGAMDARRATPGAPKPNIAANAPRKGAVPKAANATYERMRPSVDVKSPFGSQKNPYVARDWDTLNRLPKGSYAVAPNGDFGIVD